MCTLGLDVTAAARPEQCCLDTDVAVAASGGRARSVVAGVQQREGRWFGDVGSWCGRVVLS
eukprot:COSAG02_NODE_3780_length_6242_cov_10.962559_2_plen_61_part_00